MVSRRVTSGGRAAAFFSCALFTRWAGDVSSVDILGAFPKAGEACPRDQGECQELCTEPLVEFKGLNSTNVGEYVKHKPAGISLLKLLSQSMTSAAGEFLGREPAGEAFAPFACPQGEPRPSAAPKSNCRTTLPGGPACGAASPGGGGGAHQDAGSLQALAMPRTGVGTFPATSILAITSFASFASTSPKRTRVSSRPKLMDDADNESVSLVLISADGPLPVRVADLLTSAVSVAGPAADNLSSCGS
mmetsp:Transcript_37425/g.67623  ORF Transcript_37425/g.67623 Transcript_37425/m.67623 type:complete len:247 (-) Transcript_37425:468-1208(-)